MSYAYKRGFIGTKEVNLAISELESLSYMKDENLFIGSKMNGRIISIQWYKDIEELLGDNEHIDTYLNREDYVAQMLQVDEDFIYNEDEDEYKELVYIFKGNKIAYKSSCGDSGACFYDDDKAFAIKNLVGRDMECSYFNYEDAMNNLKGNIDYLNEDLVISLLS